MIPLLRCVTVVTCCLFAGAAHAQDAGLLQGDLPGGDSAEALRARLPNATDDLRAAAMESEAVGWDLFRYACLVDVAHYIVARDAPAEAKARAADCIVTREGGWRVRFFTPAAPGKFDPLVDVVFSPDDPPSVHAGDALAPFTEHELALARARQVVQQGRSPPCPDTYDVVALPATDGTGDVWVYQLRDPLFSEDLPIGQHVRYTFSADGMHLLSERDFGPGCSLVHPSMQGSAPGYVYTDPLEAQPNEVHVYLSLRHHHPLYLTTAQASRRWRVAGGQIGLAPPDANLPAGH